MLNFGMKWASDLQAALTICERYRGTHARTSWMRTCLSGLRKRHSPRFFCMGRSGIFMKPSAIKVSCHKHTSPRARSRRKRQEGLRGSPPHPPHLRRRQGTGCDVRLPRQCDHGDSSRCQTCSEAGGPTLSQQKRSGSNLRSHSSCIDSPYDRRGNPM